MDLGADNKNAIFAHKFKNCPLSLSNLEKVMTSIKMELLMSEMSQDPIHLMMDYIHNKKPFQTSDTDSNSATASNSNAANCDSDIMNSDTVNAPTVDVDRDLASTNLTDEANVSGNYFTTIVIRIIERLT